MPHEEVWIFLSDNTSEEFMMHYLVHVRAIHTKNDNRNHNYISVHTNDNLLFIIRSFMCDCSCCMTAYLLI